MHGNPADRHGPVRRRRRLDGDRRAARAGALEVPVRRDRRADRGRGAALRRHRRAARSATACSRVFGAPVGHEDDAERAVRAALAIQAAIATYGEELRSGYGIELAVRVAVNTGPVVLTDDDDGADRYNALGDTANVAARLQELAPSGGIVVGPETERQIAARASSSSRSARSSSAGSSARCAPPASRARAARRRCARSCRWSAAARARGARRAPARRSPTAAARSSPSRASRASASRASWSRRARRYGDRIRFLEGRAGSYAESFPYWPVRDLLRDWLGIGVGRARGPRAARAEGGARRPLGEDAESAYPFLARLLGLPLEAEADAALRELSREAVQQQTFAAMARRRAPPRRGAPALHRRSTTCSGRTRSRSSCSRTCSR